MALILGCALAAWAEAPAILPTVHAVHSLSHAQAAQRLPVLLEATVTYYRKADFDLFVQQGEDAIWVYFKQNADLVPGDRVLIKGTTGDSFQPVVISESVTLLHHGAPPDPVPASFDQLIRQQLVCSRVTVHAVIRSANLVWGDNDAHEIYLQLLMDGGYIDAAINSDDPAVLSGLLDSEAEITGVVAEKFDGKKQPIGAQVWVQSSDDVKIIKPAGSNPGSLPIMPIEHILTASHVQDETRRVRVEGTITYYQPGSSVVIQNGAQSLWTMTLADAPMRVGDIADVSGFPDVRNGFPTLTHSEVEDKNVRAPIAPRPVSWREVSEGSRAFDLVSIEGRLVTEVEEASQDEYVLLSDGHLVSAVYQHPTRLAELFPPSMKHIAMGSRIRVTGISMYYNSDPFNGPLSADILMRTFDDIVIVAPPSLLGVRNLVILVGLLFAVVISLGCRAWILERKVRRKTAALAYIEQRRSRILEAINGSRALVDILEQITELVSCKLDGAPSWIQVAGGAQIGNCPPHMAEFRIVQQEVCAGEGPGLGIVFAALDPLTTPRTAEPDALAMSSALAALAIETRNLHSDLLHRSEFDQLTSAHNRFSFDRRLDALVVESRNAASIFGFIYIDLDKFKEVNDLYGHLIGDRYLQEVSLRMTKQLRSQDLLARLGGDEFAVLVPAISSREGVAEIARRLERCIDEPFSFDGCTIHGSVSVGIAVYPEDGDTEDTLLKAADAAMYASKNSHRMAGQVSAHGE